MQQSLTRLCLFFAVFIGINRLGVAQEFLPKSNGKIVTHTYYTLSYSEEHEQAEWVYYALTPAMLKGQVARTNNFRSDPKVFSGSAQSADYKYSGYDKGHLVPAGDMTISIVAMRESFYMSNMSPQSPSFNRGIWKKLENLVRKWASEEKLHIATGGILVNGLQELGENGVDIPKHFYKIIYAPDKQEMIAFILPNEKVQNALSNYVVSVDSVETLTHIDFFPQLPDDIEQRIESKVNPTHWRLAPE